MNKQWSQQRIAISLMICFLLIIILTVIILIPFLFKTKSIKSASLRWNPEGITIAGVSNVSGTAANLLYYPYDIVVAWSYAMYVADRSNNRIQKFLRGSSNATTVAGRADGVVGSTMQTFRTSNFLLVDDDGNIYVSDAGNYRVMFWKKDATQGIIVAGNGSAGNSMSQLNNSHGLAYDRQSNILFVSDYANHRVMKYLNNSSTGIVVGGNNTCGTSKIYLCEPHGLFFEQSSNSLLIANSGANNIVRWILDDIEWSIVFGNSNGVSGNSPSTLYFPTDVMVDPMDNIYVVDRSNHRVQFFAVGQLKATTIAGQTGRAGVNATLLRYPNSLTFDNQLNLYVADFYNHRIQKFLRY